MTYNFYHIHSSTHSQVTIETTKELALIGTKLGLGSKYFEGLNNHLYNADGVFLPLSTNQRYIDLTVQILDSAIEEDMDYDPAPFKRTKLRLSKKALTTINIGDLAKDTGFRARAANSPLFYHLGDEMTDIVEMYRNGATGYWKPAASLVPGHNQACERLVGDLKRSKDINALVTLSERREKRPRKASKHVLKGGSLEGV